MQKIWQKSLVTIGLTLLLTGYPLSIKAQNVNPQDQKAIESVIYSNIEALNQEDVDKCMETIDPSSPGYQLTKAITQSSFSQYDLNYVINNVEVLNVLDDQAQVRVQQTTTKIKGPDFRNNVVTIIHTLQKVNGEWKLYETKLEKIEYLN